MVGGDAHELELILAEGVGLVRTPSESSTSKDLAESRDRCYVTLLGSDDPQLQPFFVSLRVNVSVHVAVTTTIRLRFDGRSTACQRSLRSQCT